MCKTFANTGAMKTMPRNPLGDAAQIVQTIAQLDAAMQKEIRKSILEGLETPQAVASLRVRLLALQRLPQQERRHSALY